MSPKQAGKPQEHKVRKKYVPIAALIAEERGAMGHPIPEDSIAFLKGIEC